MFLFHAHSSGDSRDFKKIWETCLPLNQSSDFFKKKHPVGLKAYDFMYLFIYSQGKSLEYLDNFKNGGLENSKWSHLKFLWVSEEFHRLYQLQKSSIRFPRGYRESQRTLESCKRVQGKSAGVSLVFSEELHLFII